MKYFLTIILFLSISTRSIAQKNEGDKVYWVALKKFVSAVDTFYFKKMFSDKTIYLEKPEFVDSIPDVVDGYKIVLLTQMNKKKIYQAHKNKLIHTVLQPLQLVNDSLLIRVIPYRAHLEKHNHYFLGVSDGTTVYFKFDSDQKKYIVSSVKNWGI